jgi:hypothetical protein
MIPVIPQEFIARGIELTGRKKLIGFCMYRQILKRKSQLVIRVSMCFIEFQKQLLIISVYGTNLLVIKYIFSVFFEVAAEFPCVHFR